MTNAWIFVHIVGVLGFLGSHGSSAAVALRLRKERRPERVEALLGLSASTRMAMYVSLLLLVGGGIGAAASEKVLGQGWIWVSAVTLVAMLLAAISLAIPYSKRVRLAVEAASARSAEPGAPPGPAGTSNLATLLGSSRPLVIALVETAGILFILWLMVFKPF
jgi:uncharacterized membrane protein